MSSSRWILACVLLVGIAATWVGSGATATSGTDWEKVLEQAKITLVEAIQKAEKKTEGKAVAAEMEMEGGKLIMEVVVFKGGESPGLLEVEVSGETGEILEIESEDDEDEDDEDEDEEDEEDEGEDDEDEED